MVERQRDSKDFVDYKHDESLWGFVGGMDSEACTFQIL